MTPDLTKLPEGPYGTAQWFDPELFREKWPATVAMWLITAPPYFEMWSQYVLGVISLAEFPGVMPAKRDNAEQTHELFVGTLNPDAAAQSVTSIIETGVAPIMTPINVAERFTVASDEHAAELGWLHVWAVLNGFLNPEPFGLEMLVRAQWRHSIRQSVDHLAGRHG